MTSVFDDDRIRALKTDLVTYGREITDHISALYSSQRSKQDSFNLKNDPLNMLLMLKHEMNDILKVSEEHVEYNASHRSEMKECNDLVETLSNIAALTDLILDCEKAISTFSFVSACDFIDQIRSAMEKLPTKNTDIGGGNVCTVLRNEFRLLNSRLNSKLRRCFAECIHFEPGRVSVCKVLRGLLRSEDVVLEDASPLLLADLWAAAARCGRADEAVRDVLDKFFHCLLRPVWSEKKPQTPQVTADGDAGAELVLDLAAEAAEGKSDRHFDSSSESLAGTMLCTL